MNSQSADIEAKKAKKRAWDRVAQRTLRQKTKSHIEYLEQTVRALQSQTSEDFVVNLIQEKEHLLAENEHLRKIITDARIMLSVYHPSSSPPSKAEARRSLLAIHRVCSSSNYNSQEHRSNLLIFGVAKASRIVLYPFALQHRPPEQVRSTRAL
ncbi:hypothetical protein BDV29DRAFT_129627 [Aspergillus leporis]|uniref:BZIP domain-containing protein n=1 Tax=Aspergillus leporis TaxID=41062 RepID=A0A5N5XDG6_9EURO|nr:hypothetical protein BDV29DRAFT_129627 [Aspergillus leporis]